MHLDAEAFGTVEVCDGRLAARAALGVEIGDAVGEAGAMQPRDAAEFGLAIGAASRRDDEGGFPRCGHPCPLFRSCCACRSTGLLPSVQTRTALRQAQGDRKSTRLNSSHYCASPMPHS